MSRRHSAEKREIIPDAKFGDVILTKFMNSIMYDGKKSAAEAIVYGAFEHDREASFGRSRCRCSGRARECGARHRGALPSCRWRDLPGARRGASRAPTGSGDPLAHHGGSGPQRQDDGRPTVRRTHRCFPQPRQRREEAGRHSPHGGGEPRLLPLPLVTRRRPVEDSAMPRSHPIEDYRNFGIMAHIDAGQDDDDRADPLLLRQVP